MKKNDYDISIEPSRESRDEENGECPDLVDSAQNHSFGVTCTVCLMFLYYYETYILKNFRNSSFQ